MTNIERQAEQQFQKMTETPIWRLIIQLSIPTIITMLITNIYNVVDTAFVGRLGTSASGAVGVVFGFMAIIQAFGFLFGQGGGSIVSRLLGNREIDRATTTASTAFACSLFMGVVLSVFGFVSLDSLVVWLGSTPTIAPYAKSYIIYILVAAPFMTTSFTMNNLLRYEGKAALGMVGMLTGSILNIAGDYVLMFVFKMGIAGAGLSTCLSQVISWGILLSMFVRGKTTSRLRMTFVQIKAALLSDIVLTGLPSLLRQALNSVTTILLNVLAASYGDEAVAAMSIVNRVTFFVFSIALGMGQGYQPVSAFNYGAHRYRRVRKALWFTLISGEIFITLAAFGVIQFPDDIIRIFRDDAAVVAIGHRALILQMLVLPSLPLCVVTEMTYQCTGHKAGAALLSSLRGGVFFIPSLLILSKVHGLSGIQEAQPLAYIFSFVISIVFLTWYLGHLPKEDELPTND
ncbi:MAG: MATE family efflux transporter [Lachnospiraceae bacterium]|nr:MATE family efflux transporter [Lachnospiraceae bacterium]